MWVQYANNVFKKSHFSAWARAILSHLICISWFSDFSIPLIVTDFTDCPLEKNSNLETFSKPFHELAKHSWSNNAEHSGIRELFLWSKIKDTLGSHTTVCGLYERRAKKSHSSLNITDNYDTLDIVLQLWAWTAYGICLHLEALPDFQWCSCIKGPATQVIIMQCKEQIANHNLFSYW